MAKKTTYEVECILCLGIFNHISIKPTLSKPSIFTIECKNCESELLVKARTAGIKQALITVLDIKPSKKGQQIIQARADKARNYYEPNNRNDVIQSDGTASNEDHREKS